VYVMRVKIPMFPN